VESIRLEGVTALDAAIIRRSIKTRASRCRSPLFVVACRVGDWSWAETKVTIDTMEARRDVERIKLLYEAWGFPDAQVDGEIIPQRDGDVVVRFRLTEGEPIVIREIVVRGIDSIPGFKLPNHLPLRVGEPYALPRLEDTQNVLRTLLAQHGYPLSEIEVSGDLNAATRSATLVLDVNPGRLVRFGDTRFRVERPIDETVARNRVAYKSGDPFSINAIERTERSLYALPIVERATAEPTRTPAADSIVDMVVSVEARRAAGLSGEALLSSTDCGELRGFWQHRYFLGGPRVFALGVSASNLFAEQADGDFPCTSAGTGAYGKPELGVEADLRQFMPPIRRSYNATDIADAVCQVLIEARVDLVLVDEIHNLNLATSAGEDMSDHLKYFTEHLPATFVYAGINVERCGLFTGVRGKQIAGRCVLITTAPFPYQQEWSGLVATLENALRLHHHQVGTLTGLDRYLHQRTGGMIGSLSHLIRAAALTAIMDGSETITRELLESIPVDHAAQSDTHGAA
jgi:hypothetical protein